MSIVLRRAYSRVKNNLLYSKTQPSSAFIVFSRAYGDDKPEKDSQFSSSTILVESGYNVHELPVIVRRLTDLSGVPESSGPTDTDENKSDDSYNYELIQAEFKECHALRDIFSLLSKCSKITPTIALGAMERIYDLEKTPHELETGTNSIVVAKDAIVDKLLKVVMKTDETQTILNALKSVSSFIDPYKYSFCDEILLRVIDNKLSIEQLADFMIFLVKNKTDLKYSAIIDKLWVGFVEKEHEISESNIGLMFTLLPNLQDSKRTILNLLEQKLSELWYKLKTPGMQDILNTFILEKQWCPQSFAIAGRWLNTNIHSLDEDSLLEIITKFTKLKYNDEQIEKAVKKYLKQRGHKIESPILIVGILNYCMQFKIRDSNILDRCSEHFLLNGHSVPHSFINSIIYPYGYLNYDPVTSDQFWNTVEEVVNKKFDKISCDDLSSIVLAFIYAGKHPVELVHRMLNTECVTKATDNSVMRKLHLIDTAMTMECKDYVGPLLARDYCPKVIVQDGRVKQIIKKIQDSLIKVAGDSDKLSTSVSIPNMHSDETYLIDVMLHPVGLGSNTFNWKVKSEKNEIIAVLVHTPEHYCSDDVRLVGPQEMRRRHMRLLGMKVVSLRYSLLSKYQGSHNKKDLEKYLLDSIRNAESCL